MLGEGPLWDSGAAELYWVDIEASCFHRWRRMTGDVETIRTEVPVTSIHLVAGSGALLMTTTRGFELWDGTLRLIATSPEPGRTAARLNDAAVDARGRLWAGTLGAGFESGLYCLGPRRVLRQVEFGLGVANGIGWSPDWRTMYVTDTRRRVIFAYDFDADAGTVSQRREFVRVGDGQGVPDGLTVDSEGYVWSARWGGWRIVRYDPLGGMEREVRLPVSHPTSCAFGGPDLDELYVTSASAALSAAEREQQPRAGDLFRIRAGIRGRAPTPFQDSD